MNLSTDMAVQLAKRFLRLMAQPFDQVLHRSLSNSTDFSTSILNRCWNLLFSRDIFSPPLLIYHAFHDHVCNHHISFSSSLFIFSTSPIN